MTKGGGILYTPEAWQKNISTAIVITTLFVFLWVIHNIDNGGRKYDRNGVGIIRGRHKKTEKRDPRPPINLDAQIFSAKGILDWARPPPFWRKIPEKKLGI